MFFNRLESISTNDLQQKLSADPTQQDFKLLDVRTPGEFTRGHIAGAENIPLDKISSFTGSKEIPLYVICGSGVRSKKAVNLLTKAGYSAVNVAGGMQAWNGPQEK